MYKAMNLPKLPSLPKLQQVSQLWSKSKKTVSQTYTVVDIGSSQIRVAIIEMTDDGVAILGRGHASPESGTMYGGQISNLDNLISALEEAISQATNRAGVTSEQVILGLGGAMVSSVTTMVQLNRPQAREKITNKEFNNILERISQTALVDAENVASEEMALEKEELRLVNAAITSISLDGYAVATPIGFSGKEVQICLYSAFIAQQTLVVLQKIITDLDVDLTSLVSAPYALGEVVIAQAKKPQHAEGIIINIGSGSTSVTLVQNGSVVGSQSFPLAGQAITNHIAQSLGVSIQDAEKLKHDYAEGRVLEDQQKKIHPIVTGEVDLWLQGLTLALGQLQRGSDPLPQIVYLSGGGSQLPDIEQRLIQEKWSKKVGFAAKPDIEYLKTDAIPFISDQNASLEQGDSMLAALALFWYQRQKEDEHVSTALQKTLESLG